MLYLDHSATGLLLPTVRERMIEAMDDYYGNASALHTPGHLTHNAIEQAREYVAQAINAKPSEIILTSGGSEANNTVINIWQGEKVAVSEIEHPSLLEPARKFTDCEELRVGRAGRVQNLDGMREGTKLVSVMLANNEVGTMNDIVGLARQAHRRGALLHSDATQGLGKVKIDVRAMGVDYLTMASHKIGGPAGVGALFVREGAPFAPFLLGGHQERGRRSGTYAVINIVGFGEAARVMTAEKTVLQYEQKVRPLRDWLAKEILTTVPHAQVNHDLAQSLPNLLNVSFAAAEGESIQLYLDALEQIIVSTGSACAAGDGKPSHVLMALYGDAEVAHSSIRFSLGLENTRAEVGRVVKALAPIIRRLQGMSTIKITGGDDE